MQGTTILLLGAATLVAYASAHPYSKIPEGATLPNAYNFKRSSSNSNSNSYSQSNQDESDVNGAYNGQSFSGTKSTGYSTSGGSRSQSSSYASSSFNGNVPIGIFGTSGLPGASQTPSSYIQPELAYGNPGTAGLGLNDKPSILSSGAYSSSYGSPNAGPSHSGSSDHQITEGAHGAGLSSSYSSAGIGSSESGSSAGVKGASSGSNSGYYGSSGGSSFGQAGIGSIGSGLNTGIKGGHSGSNSGIYGSSGGASFGQAGIGSIESSTGGISGSSDSGTYGSGGEQSFEQAGPSSSGYVGQAGSQPGAVQYWWNGADSPFGSSGKPSGGCTSNACSLAGSFDLHKGAGGAHASNQGGQVGLNINSGNPFLSNGQAGSGSGFISSDASIGQSGIESGSGFISSGSSIGQSGIGSGSGFDRRPIDGSKNPFLNGAYFPGAGGSGINAGSGSFASANAGSSASSFGSATTGSSGSTGSFNGAGNPFLNSGSGSTFGQVPVGSGPVPSSTPGYEGSQSSGFGNVGIGANNPFFKPGSGSVVITPPIAKFPDQSNQGSFPFPSPTPGFPSQSTVSVLLIPEPTPSIPSLNPNLGFGGSTPGYPGASGSFGSAGTGDFQGQIGQHPSFPSQSTIDSGIPTLGYSTPSTLITEQEPSRIYEGLTVSCSGQGKICVIKSLCVNGRVSSNQQGLTQVRTGPQLCKVGREVCCSLDRQYGSSTSFGTGQNTGFSSSGSSSNSNSGNTDQYQGFSGISGKPTVPSTIGIQGQSGQFGSTNNFGQSGNRDQSGSFGSSGSFGQNEQSGSYDQSQQKESFDQNEQSGSYDQSQQKESFGQNEQSGSYDQSQQKESFDFGSQSSSQASAGSSSSFGNQGSGFTQGFHLPSSSGTPAPSLISVTPGSGFRKPTVTTYTGGNPGYASANANANANANAEASGQAGSGITGSYIHPSPVPAGSGIFTNIKKQGESGGLFGSSENSGEDLSAGEPSYKGSTFGVKESSASNGYLPPFGSEPSSNVPAFSKPPKEEESGPSNLVPDVKRPPPRPTFIPQPIAVPVGCAAALICVEEKFCTLEGVISPEPVALTSQQIERRAPLSSCRNPDSGIIGKCCRDPNYVDPWPTGNLPANYTGGFDEQGFPSYLNYAKTHPPKKQPTAIKGGFRPPIKGFGVNPTPTPKGWVEDFGQAISDRFNITPPTFTWPPNLPSLPSFPDSLNPFANRPSSTGEKPSESESATGAVPFPTLTADSQATEKPNTIFGIIVPSFPTFIPSSSETSSGSRTYDLSATNQNPTIIAPHTPGAQCGLRNKVQRPSGLDRDDVAFGEIPWQAMVLSTTDRKLLCSGAIVAPNAVLTAAHCVAGFKSGEVSIKSGEWKLGYELKHEEPLPFEIVKVSNIVSHPGFQQGSPSHDLAILFLEHPVALDQHVDILCLGDIPQPKLGRKCIATGWGKIVLQVNVAGSLMHGIDVDVLSQNECRQRLQGAESQIQIDNTLACVKAHNQRNNMCQVDVGGPLACDRGDGHYELTGIYSQETGCLPTNQVASFALIDTNWVKKNLASPPRVPIPSYEVDLPHSGEYPSSSNVQTNFEAQVKQPEKTCDCQQSHLPPELGQYLPPV